jgi:hypothetical protein
VLALARFFQLVADDCLGVGLDVSRFDIAAHGVDIRVPNATTHHRFQPALDDLSEASQLLADRLRLADENLKDAVLGALEIDEVVAEDLFLRLELAVDAAVTLLHP